MGRCSANHHKSQAISSTYIEIMVVLQMEQIQTKDRQMEIAPMVSCHSWHYRLCSLFIPISKPGYVMDLDRTNRVFYKKIIMDEKRKKDYQELDSLIHSDSFFTTFRSLEH
ncbi:hypothetical protein [Segatella hominis]|uniref:hypothetical protein n=1 Tax=Segatella hominis TaxID=2518605 RepID=UPI003AAE3EF2